jgi:hypothetical protein
MTDRFDISAKADHRLTMNEKLAMLRRFSRIASR